MRHIKSAIIPVFMWVDFPNLTKWGFRQVHKSLPHLHSGTKQVCFCKVHLAANRCQIISKTDITQSQTFLRSFFLIVCFFFITILCKKSLPVGFYSVLSVYTPRLTFTISPASSNLLRTFFVAVGFPSTVSIISAVFFSPSASASRI